MGVFLCLNITQCIVAIIRMAGIRSRFTLDHTWNDFWQQIEVSIAISMVSITAFRSFFVAERSRARARRYRQWYSTPSWKVFTGSSSRSQPNRGEEEELQTLPHIPSATLTGVRTFIRRDGLESRWEPEPEPEPVRAENVESRESLSYRRQEPSKALGP